MKKQEYICTVCKTTTASSGEPVPVHCGKEMKPHVPLEPCTGVHAEMARDGDDACDDGRGQGSV